MTLFTIDKDGNFSEFNQKIQETVSEEMDLYGLVEKNPDSVFQNTNILLIGRKVETDSGHTIDFLGVDRNGNTILIDIKKEKASNKTLMRLIVKGAFIDTFDYYDLNAIYKGTDETAADLSSVHADFFNLNGEEIAWNEQTKLVLVSQKISNDLRQSANYLLKHGLKISCVIFKYFSYSDDLKMISREFVISEDDHIVPEFTQTFSAPKTEKEKFFHSLDDIGQMVFSQIDEFATKQGYELKWTAQGFLLSVLTNNEPIGICYGYTQDSLLNQSIYTGFDQILKWVNSGEEIVESFKSDVEELDMFSKTRSSYRWEVTEKYNSEEVNAFCLVLKEVADKIIENGLVQVEADAAAF